MRTHGHATLLTTGLMVATLGIFHIARPVAVSAQASASLTVSATVVPSNAAWSGHEMSMELAQSAETEGLLVERDGTIAWLEPAPAATTEPTVTVAHLGS
jgi:hypothetical protein